MSVALVVDIPDQLAERLGGTGQDLSRQALEALVLESYRQSRIAGPEAATILGFSRVRWEQFLEDHHVLENSYSVEDLERDVATLHRLRAGGQLSPL